MCILYNEYYILCMQRITCMMYLILIGGKDASGSHNIASKCKGCSCRRQLQVASELEMPNPSQPGHCMRIPQPSVIRCCAVEAQTLRSLGLRPCMHSSARVVRRRERRGAPRARPRRPAALWRGKPWRGGQTPSPSASARPRRRRRTCMRSLLRRGT